MITGMIIGDRELIAKLGKMPEGIQRSVAKTIDQLGLRLIEEVVRNKLSGQVLKRRTGRLASSIARGAPDTRSHFEQTGTTAISYVGTNVSYGRTWEYGAHVPEYIVRPVKAKALHFFFKGTEVFAKSARIPAHDIKARPFLSTALQDMKPLIIRELTDALTKAAQDALK